MAVPQYLLRFRNDAGNPTDIYVSADSAGEWRFASVDRSEVVPVYDSVSGIAIGDTGIVYDSGVLTEFAWLAGTQCTSSTDGQFKVKLDGVTIGWGNSNINNQTPAIEFPNLVFCPVGSQLTVEALNVGIVTGTYEAVLYFGV